MSWIEDVSKRGRHSRVEVNTDNPRQKRAILTIHHQYYDDGGLWLPVNENIADDTSVSGFVASVKGMRHQVLLGSTGGRRWIPRREFPQEYVTLARPQYRRTNGTWANLSIGTMVKAGNVLSFVSADYIIRLTVTWRRLKFDYELTNSNAPTRIRFGFTLNGLTWDGYKLVGQDGQVAGWLDPLVAWDANGSAMNANVPVLTSVVGGYVDFEVNTAGVTFPVTVDPTFTDGYGGDVNTAFDFRTKENDANNGSSTWNMWEGNATAGQRGFPICKFNVSSLAGNTVTAATLYGYAGEDASNDFTWSFHAILAANSGMLETGCWNYADKDAWSDPLVRWAGDTGANGGTDAGCSVSGTDYNATEIGTWTVLDAAVAGAESTAILTNSAVQAWIDTGNYGLVAVPTAYGRMASSDHATTGYRPKLVVTYTEAGGEGSAGGTITAIRTNSQPPFWGRF